MKTVLPAFAILTLLFSCKKDDAVKPSYDVTGKYLITKLVFQSKGNPDQDLLAGMPDCAKDDLLVFSADSTFTKEDGAVSCGDDTPAPVTWYTKGNKMQIDGVQSVIISFDKRTLVLSTPMMLEDVQGTILETLERQ
jgi:hypothetical protein